MIGKTNASSGKSFYPSAKDITISYTGDMAALRDIYDSNNNKYKLLELTSSGVLTFNKKVAFDICAVGGGGNGYAGRTSSMGASGAGGAGAYLLNTGMATNGLTIIVGSGGGGQTIIKNLDGTQSIITLNQVNTNAITQEGAYGGSGGSGGGAANGLISGETPASHAGSGDGISKYVFNDNSVYNYPICAAGGSGSASFDGTNSGSADGGSNGSNGSYTYGTNITVGGNGGNNGGGNGGNTINSVANAGANATSYGSGGGGGASYINRYTPAYSAASGGTGMQGVVFIRIPY